MARGRVLNPSDRRNAQLPLKLPINRKFSRDDLIVGKANARAVALIDQWPDWSSHVLVLAGPTGSGKSHLATIWANMAEAQVCQAGNFDDDWRQKVEGGNVVIEDMSATNLNETALFHLINQLNEKGHYGLITSSLWPVSWNIKLPDLQSRLRAATLVEIEEPDDILLRQTLVKLFSDRQIVVEKTVIDYLAVRMERSVAAAQLLVERLDQTAMAEARPITRGMAAKVINEMFG